MSSSVQELLKAAKEQQKNAYAPYSRHHVGAAVLAENGKIYSGCNVENAALPVGICAEPSAISKAVGDGQRKLKELLVITHSPTPSAPCGACRQFISEFAAPDLMIHMCDAKGNVESMPFKELLPKQFDPAALQRGQK